MSPNATILRASKERGNKYDIENKRKYCISEHIDLVVLCARCRFCRRKLYKSITKGYRGEVVFKYYEYCLTLLGLQRPF